MQRKLKYLLGAILCLSVSIKTIAQSFHDRYFKNGTYIFNDLQKIEQSTLFTTYKSEFGLGNNDEMVPTNNVVDSNGIFRTKYQLYHKGVLVQGSIMNVLGDKGIVRYVNGFLLTGLDADTSNLISQQNAIEAAIAYIDADLYPWEDSLTEAILKETDSNATNYPQTADLIITKKRGDTFAHVDSNYQLCYMVTIQTLDPGSVTDVYVNANTGDIFTSQNAVRYDFTAIGSGWTWYDGQFFNIKTRSCGSCSNYWLHDVDRDIYTTRDAYHYWEKGSWNKDNNNSWTDDNTKTAATAHWAIQRAWEYYINRHGRWGSNYNGRLVHIKTKADPELGWSANAGHRLGTSGYDVGHDLIFLSSDGMQPGSSTVGNPGYSIAELDVMAHEYTHAMIRASSELGILGDYEADALNEGYADIFGNRIERYTLPSVFWDWNIAQGVSWFTRNLDNPHSDVPNTSPERYMENSFWKGNNFHADGGVIRKWFYLIAQGGTLAGNTVTPLGLETADDIAYITFNWWLWGNVSYPAAAWQTVHATVDRYGTCSNEHKQVVKALRAVGFNIPNPHCFKVDIYGDAVVSLNLLAEAEIHPELPKPVWTVKLNEIANESGAYQWRIPESWHVRVNNKQVTLDSVDNDSSQYLSVIYTTAIDTFYDTIVVHFSDIEWQATNNMPEARMAQPLDEEFTKTSHISLYPNPANTTVMFNVDNFQGSVRCEIYDLSGRLVRAEALTNVDNEIDISDLDNGMYLIRIISNETISTQKLTVVH